MKFSIENLSPPSINHYYIFGSHKFRALSARGKSFKQTLGMIAKASGFKPLNGDIALCIVWARKDKRRRDIDNILKPILDSLNGIGYKDDSQIKDLRVKTFLSDVERLEIEVRKLED